MPPPELYGPFGALAALAFVILALMHGDLVPGYLYRQERAQREKAETQAERNTTAIEAVAATVKEAINDGRGTRV